MRSGGSPSEADVPSPSRYCTATERCFGISAPKRLQPASRPFPHPLGTRGRGEAERRRISPCPAPFLFVGRNLVGCGMGLLCVGWDLELRRLVLHQIVEGDIVTEHLRHRHFFKYRLPGTLRLTRPTINAVIGMDIELVG